MKKLLLILLFTAVIIVAAIFVYRYEIFKYSAEKIFMETLSKYLKVDSFSFDLKNSEICVEGLRIQNPPGFSDNPLLKVESILCRYKLRSKNILDGVEILELTAHQPTLNIERSKEGRINTYDMKGLDKAPQARESGKAEKAKTPRLRIGSQKKMSELLKLPDVMRLDGGRIVFTDNALYNEPYILTFDNIKSDVTLRLNDDYSQVLYVTSTGSGNINGRPDESAEWVISLTPTTPKLTMSNHFKVYDAEMLPFVPYFDQYSPFTFRTGRFSGDIIFDFDNGSIGSTVTVSLDDLSFYIKSGFDNAIFWETTIPDLVKYLTSRTGAVVFDFKIKGEMSKPRFYLGPITKAAIAAMAVDKIGKAAVDAASRSSQGDGEKVQQIVDIVKGFMNK